MHVTQAMQHAGIYERDLELQISCLDYRVVYRADEGGADRTIPSSWPLFTDLSVGEHFQTHQRKQSL